MFRAAKFCFPEGFSMRAGVQLCLQAPAASRVDKPRKEEAAGGRVVPMEKERFRLVLTMPLTRG